MLLYWYFCPPKPPPIASSHSWMGEKAKSSSKSRLHYVFSFSFFFLYADDVEMEKFSARIFPFTPAIFRIPFFINFIMPWHQSTEPSRKPRWVNWKLIKGKKKKLPRKSFDRILLASAAHLKHFCGVSEKHFSIFHTPTKPPWKKPSPSGCSRTSLTDLECHPTPESTDTHILMEIYSACTFFFVSISLSLAKLSSSSLHTPPHGLHLRHTKKKKTIRREKSFFNSHIYTRILSRLPPPHAIASHVGCFLPLFRDFLMFVLLLMICRRKSVAEESRNRARSRHNLTYFNNFLLLLGKSFSA